MRHALVCCVVVRIFGMYDGVMYIRPSPPSPQTAHLSALGSSRLFALGPAHTPTEGGGRRAFSVFSKTPNNSQYTSHTGQKGAITEFRTSWGGLISRLLVTVPAPSLAAMLYQIGTAVLLLMSRRGVGRAASSCSRRGSG
jgi:hypothetical protein